MSKPRIRALAIAGSALFLTTAVVTQGGASPAPGGSLNDARDLPIMQANSTLDTGQASQLAAIESDYRTAPTGSLLAAADFASAHPVSRAAGLMIWLAPTSGGGLCVFAPEPGTSPARFAASCSTLAELNATGNVSAAVGPTGAVIAAVQPDGVPVAAISHLGGAPQALAGTDNVAVALAQGGDTVTVGSAHMLVPQT